MRTYWYWPHPHRGSSPLVEATLGPGDAAVVQSLATWRGEQLVGEGAGYRVVRTLPEMRPGVGRGGRWLADRLTVRVRRAWQRHRLVGQLDPDVCYIELLDPAVDIVALRLLARRRPVVAMVHDVRPHAAWRLRRVQLWLADTTVRHLDHVVVFHEVLRDELVREVGVAAEAVSVVPHPRALPASMPPGRAVDGPIRVLFFGALRANKGVDLLLAAAVGLDPARVAVHVAGAGPPEVEEQVRAAATADLVTAEVGFVDEERRHELFRLADVVVLPYRDFHAQSGVLGDAMAYGVAVVATDVGALGATVTTAGCGLVVPPGDAVALGAAIERLVDDESLRARCASSALAAARGQTPAVVGRELRAVLAGVVSRR